MNNLVKIIPKEICEKDIEFFTFQDKLLGFDKKNLKFLNFRKLNLPHLDEYSCFYGNFIIRNGNLIIGSWLDPLFLLVDLYDMYSMKNGHMFYSLENLFLELHFSCFNDVYSLGKLEKVFHVQEISEQVYVKLNQTKFINYLCEKLKDKDVSQCIELLKEYVNSKYLTMLKQELNIKEETRVEYYVEQISSTKRGAKEDLAPVKEKKKKKINIEKGMKNIASFFQKI